MNCALKSQLSEFLLRQSPPSISTSHRDLGTGYSIFFPHLFIIISYHCLWYRLKAFDTRENAVHNTNLADQHMYKS